MLEAWIDSTIDIYATDSQRFLRGNTDPFANPVGHTIAVELRRLLDGLLAGDGDDSTDQSLDQIVRLISVQELAPSTAISFVFRVKDLLRAQLSDCLRSDAMRELEDRVDRLALRAFDHYSAQQRRIADIRIRENRGQVATILRMNQIAWQDAECDLQPRKGGGE